MASTTANYGLATDVVLDDFVEPEHQNRVADTVDHVLGGFLASVIQRGALEGWEIGGNKSVSAGQGLVGSCWCRTSGEEQIADLTDDATNYVYGAVTQSSPTEGAVAFVAQVAPPGPAGSIFLGTIALDGNGDVVSVSSDASEVERHCHALKFGALSGSEVEAAIGAGETVEFDVDHSAQGSFRVPGHLTVGCESADFGWSVIESCSGDGFAVEVTNGSGVAADFEYTWQREGVLR